MKDQANNIEPRKRDKAAIFILLILIILILVLIILTYLGYEYSLPWVGLKNYESLEIRTVWDWMELLLIPMVLAFGAYLLTKSEKSHERDLADERRRTEIELAEKRFETERTLAEDQLEQSALESFIDRMTDLMLSHDLRTSKENAEVRILARTRTLAVLRGINGKRKAQVLTFLYEAGLRNLRRRCRTELADP